MSIEIKSRWTGEVLHTVEADTLENANLAGANLHGANLYRANLDGANLYRANLDGADLYRANLHGANLDGANLHGANLAGANLAGADLYRADLYRADLYRANLYGADLDGANLYRANLAGADLDGANLYRANLYRANLDGAQNLLQAYRLGVAAGNGREISTLQLGTYHVVIASDRMMIGCQNHTITDWLSFDETRIRRLGGPKAVEWAATWRPVIEAYLTASNASTKAEATGDRPE